MSTRTELAAAIATKFGRRFAVVQVGDLPDKIAKPAVLVRHQDYTPGPTRATINAKFIVTLVNHLDDIKKAETQLDKDLPDLLEFLDTRLGLTWSSASRVLVKDRYHGFDITCSIPTASPY